MEIRHSEFDESSWRESVWCVVCVESSSVRPLWAVIGSLDSWSLRNILTQSTQIKHDYSFNDSCRLWSFTYKKVILHPLDIILSFGDNPKNLFAEKWLTHMFFLVICRHYCSTVEVWLLTFWVTRKVRHGGELMEVNMLPLDAKVISIFTLIIIVFFSLFQRPHLSVWNSRI